MSALFSHSFGQFALHLYAQPECQSLCLYLQDEHDIDINLLLWASWLDQQHLQLCDADWIGLEQRLKWRRCLMNAIRGCRRRLRLWPWAYRAAKKCELWSEAKEMQVLYRLTPQLTAATVSVQDHPAQVRQYLLHRDCLQHWPAWQDGMAG